MQVRGAVEGPHWNLVKCRRSVLAGVDRPVIINGILGVGILGRMGEWIGSGLSGARFCSST